MGIEEEKLSCLSAEFEGGPSPPFLIWGPISAPDERVENVEFAPKEFVRVIYSHDVDVADVVEGIRDIADALDEQSKFRHSSDE